jgi:hypothetical protein
MALEFPSVEALGTASDTLGSLVGPHGFDEYCTLKLTWMQLVQQLMHEVCTRRCRCIAW